MAKILSQDEIDALLSTVSSTEDIDSKLKSADDASRSIVAYDFKHPNRVSKDQIRTLESLHDNFAGHLGSSLSAIQRAMVDIELVSVDQITYSELIMSLVNPSNVFTINLEPLEGRCLIDFNPTLAFLFIDRMFGGVGRILESERELTGIERAVLSKIARNVFKELERTWTSVIKLQVRQHSFETNPQFVQIVPPGETVIVIGMQVKMLGNSGLLTICYPYVTLEPIMKDLIGNTWVDQSKKGDYEESRQLNINNLQDVTADVAAQLGTATLTVRDFMNLKLGDVIQLDQRIAEPLEISVRGRKKFLARPGIVGKKMGIQVVGTTEEQEQING
ncbi:MAG: flagellar motor switch protein FliM [candidate division Zixibacteria bacterium]|nr:flagellar motor switch protein FliM [candidate division Zixibacteria bacterium]